MMVARRDGAGRAWRPLAAVTLAAITVILAGSTGGRAQGHGLGVALSSFSPSDQRTERLFALDSGPIPQLLYTFDFDTSSLVVGVGYERWDRTIMVNGVPPLETELSFLPIFGSYRYIPWPERRATPYFGGGVAVLAYEATFTESFGFAEETGALTALEPVAGLQFRLGERVSLAVERKYSWQFLSASELRIDEVVLDVDMSGFYATAAVSARLGPRPGA